MSVTDDAVRESIEAFNRGDGDAIRELAESAPIPAPG